MSFGGECAWYCRVWQKHKWMLSFSFQLIQTTPACLVNARLNVRLQVQAVLRHPPLKPNPPSSPPARLASTPVLQGASIRSPPREGSGLRPPRRPPTRRHWLDRRAHLTRREAPTTPTAAWRTGSGRSGATGQLSQASNWRRWSAFSRRLTILMYMRESNWHSGVT